MRLCELFKGLRNGKPGSDKCDGHMDTTQLKPECVSTRVRTGKW